MHALYRRLVSTEEMHVFHESIPPGRTRRGRREKRFRFGQSFQVLSSINPSEMSWPDVVRRLRIPILPTYISFFFLSCTPLSPGNSDRAVDVGSMSACCIDESTSSARVACRVLAVSVRYGNIYPVMPGRHACQEAKLPHGHEVAGWDCQRFGSNFSAGQDELPT
jgi:hypothetical protein